MRTARTMARILLVALCLLLLGARAKPVDLVVIAHAGLGIERMDAQDLRRLYLGQEVHVGDAALVPAILRKEPMSEAFARHYLDRTASQLTTYWRRQLYSGKGLPPKAFDRQRDIVEFVRTTPGAIGFVGADAPHEGVRVLEIEE